MQSHLLSSIAGIAGAGLLALSLGGCAAGEHQEATHRWVSSGNATDNQYRADNASCMLDSFGATGQRVFETSSPEYWKYVGCMNRRGYALTATDVAATR
jgi:hypothetical protein